MQRRLRFSERKRLEETGSLGDFETDVVPYQLRNALVYFSQARSNRLSLHQAQEKFNFHFGLTDMAITGYPAVATAEGLADWIEILLEAAHPGASSTLEEELNAIFDRHRWGYRVAGGEVHQVGSPALEAAVVGPALLAVQRAGWGEAERTFKEALRHQRGGPDENDDALTAAHAALEAALKAAGLKGDRLSTLAKSLRQSALVPSQLERVPELLDDLLKRSSAIRDPHGDAHGKAPGAPEVPQALVDLAIHWTGAFIVYLAEETRHNTTP